MTYGQRNGGNGRYGRGVGHRNRNRVISETTASIAGMRVAIVRKPIKNMYLRIKPPNADIVISAPQHRIAIACVACQMGPDRWPYADAYHVASDEFALGIVHAEDRTYPT